jgi:hypothetical protein
MPDAERFLFVSHVTEDRAAALEIVGELERRGVPCWIAPRNIEPGQPFDDEIASALDSSMSELQRPRSGSRRCGASSARGSCSAPTISPGGGWSTSPTIFR